MCRSGTSPGIPVDNVIIPLNFDVYTQFTLAQPTSPPYANGFGQLDADGNVTELRCTYDPETRGGNAPDGRKVKGTIHWVSAAHALNAEVRLYEPLFTVADPGAGNDDFLDDLNPYSLKVLTGCKLEPGLADLALGETVQFERQGYFCLDPNATPAAPAPRLARRASQI